MTARRSACRRGRQLLTAQCDGPAALAPLLAVQGQQGWRLFVAQRLADGAIAVTFVRAEQRRRPHPATRCRP